jgi:putative addiction module killer protein
MGYNAGMTPPRTITRSVEFDRWLARSNRETQAIVERTLRRLVNNTVGDIKSLGGSLYEVRLTKQGGLRLYFAMIDGTLIVLLLGGDKDSQSRDIARARKILADQ